MVSIPHIYVIGAQKSGTTSLCALIDSAEGVSFARPKEPMFFCRDEWELHPHFAAEQPADWHRFDWQARQSELLESYATHFAHAAPDDQLGDGSTSYLLSHHAPTRIKALRPEAKIIVILRDPAARAYSAYWHYVKCGIACEGFAKHLQYEGGLTVRGGEYADAITHWLEHFPRGQCLFLLYEQLLAEPAAIQSQLSAFLGITIPESARLPQENLGKSPRSLSLQLALNWMNRRLGASHNAISAAKPHFLAGVLEPLAQWNLVERAYPPMEGALHHQLDIHYQRANAKLGELTGLDVTPHWYTSLR